MTGTRCLSLLVSFAWLACRAAPGGESSDHDITPGDMRARISFLSADRLRGRSTPSEGLEIAASYVSSEFARFGLEAPAGGFTQRYQLVRTEIGDGWSLALSRGGRRVVLRQGDELWGLAWAAGTVEGGLRFVSGAPMVAARQEGEPTIWVARLGISKTPRDWLAAASRAGAVGLILIAPENLHPRQQAWSEAGGTVYELGDIEPSLPAAVVAERALADALERLSVGVEPAAGESPLAGSEAVQARLSADLRIETASAPNVIGILRGSDPELREQYVLLSAHMDGLGVGASQDGDSIYNGADDNASGTAAILEVAEGMARLETPPRRSLAFLAVSGEERGLLGSSWFVEHPSIPLESIIANVNVDMVGRNWDDKIAVIGKPYSTLGALIDSVAAAHPGLDLEALDDPWPSEGFFYRSDHFNFARKGIPAVFIFNGVHEDYHRPSDEAGKIKFRKASRIAELLYEFTLALANAQDIPRWDPRVRDSIVETR
ncbi:MAG: M20/M25/M40 family metallo-hydrolase [Gemmatimonadota bacterium]|nr:MAG: M20/M25/M40 family metallo-hydrolase [Gemmatimonadota bacterium]